MARASPGDPWPSDQSQDSLPFAPAWSDVQRMWANILPNRPRDVRDRAILMLLAIYGMRSNEVASSRLDQVCWRHRVICLFRLKRRELQAYPRVRSLAEALADIDIVRPNTRHQEIFIGLQSPRRSLTPPQFKASSVTDGCARRSACPGRPRMPRV